MNKSAIKRAMKKVVRKPPKAKRGTMGARRLLAIAKRRANKP